MEKSIIQELSRVFHISENDIPLFMKNMRNDTEIKDKYFVNFMKSIPALPDEFKPKEEIYNTGSFGYVKKNKEKSFVFKHIDIEKQYLDDDRIIRNKLREPLIHSILYSYPKGKEIICALYGVYKKEEEDKTSVILVLESLGPNVHNVLINQHKLENNLPENNVRILLGIFQPFFKKYDELSNDVEFLHNDLHLKNLIFIEDPVKEDGTLDMLKLNVKLIDFGESILILKDNSTVYKYDGGLVFRYKKNNIQKEDEPKKFEKHILYKTITENKDKFPQDIQLLFGLPDKVREEAKSKGLSPRNINNTYRDKIYKVIDIFLSKQYGGYKYNRKKRANTQKTSMLRRKYKSGSTRKNRSNQ